MKVEVKHTEDKKNKLYEEGNLLIHKENKKTIILATGQTLKEDFSGICIQGIDYQYGYFSSAWDKKSFVQFNGSITLTTD